MFPIVAGIADSGGIGVIKRVLLGAVGTMTRLKKVLYEANRKWSSFAGF